MKKFLNAFSLISAVAVTTLSLAVTASAADYGKQPEYTPPPSSSSTDNGNTTTTPKDVITNDTVAEAIKSGEAIKINDNAAVLSKDSLAEIAKEGKPVTFEAEGYSIVIDPATITDAAKGIDLSIAITAGEQAQALVSDNVILPDNALLIKPAAHGEFGFTMNIVLPTKTLTDLGIDPAKAVVYYVADDGSVTKVGNVVVNADGTISVAISHASAYVITDEELVTVDTDSDEIDDEDYDDFDDVDEVDEDAANIDNDINLDPSSSASTAGTDKNPSTGVTIAFGAAGIAGIVSLVSKKSKKS